MFTHTKTMSFKNFLEKKRKEKFRKKHKVGLCLSGGGARGFAYIGAFLAFEEYNIEFDMVAGTSVGSLFGAMYASKMSAEDMINITLNVKDKDFRNSKLGFLPSKMDNLQNNLKSILPFKKIEQLKTPYTAVAVDLKTGQQVDLTSGDLSTCICGSCSIPGIYLPVKYRGMTLIDGGVKNNIPADVLINQGCDYVITIDCNYTRGSGTKSENFISQFTASVGIMMANNSAKGKKLSDILICPDLKRFSSLKIVEKNAMIEEGYRATKEAMPKILKLFSGKYKKRR